MSEEKLSKNSIAFRAIIACMLWSTAFVGIKKGLAFTTPLNFAGLRFMLAGLIILPFVGGFRKWIYEVSTHFGLILKIAFMQIFLLYLFFYSGMERVSSATAAVVIGFSPGWAALLAHFFMKNDKLTLKKSISFLIGICGIAVISFTKPTSSIVPYSTQIVGVIMLLVSSLSSAFANIVVAKDKKLISPLVLNSAQLFFGGLMLFLVSIPLEGLKPPSLNPVYLLSLGWLVFVSATAFSLWFKLLKTPKIKISFLNIWKFIIPVLGVILSLIILPEESIQISTIVGMILVALSIVIYNYKKL